MKRPIRWLTLLMLPLLCVQLSHSRPVQNPEPTFKTNPVLNGGFWQMGPWLLNDWSDAQFAREVDTMKKLGMDIIIIQHSAYWNQDRREYESILQQKAFPIQSEFQPRDPVEAILTAADRQGVKVVLGDFLLPDCWQERPAKWIGYWTSTASMNYRRQIIHRYSRHPSLYGIYIPNEPNPRDFSHQPNVKPKMLVDATGKVADYYKVLNRRLKIIHSIGLYAEPVNQEGRQIYGPPSDKYLNQFWEPFVAKLKHVDVWMVIDGVGTELSDLQHTGTAQRWGAQLAKKYHKAYWTDVENAVMGDKGYYPFDMPRLEQSLQVAAKYTDTIVTFDYLHYMSAQSPNPKARELHQAYLDYLHRVTPAVQRGNPGQERPR